MTEARQGRVGSSARADLMESGMTAHGGRRGVKWKTQWSLSDCRFGPARRQNRRPAPCGRSLPKLVRPRRFHAYVWRRVADDWISRLYWMPISLSMALMIVLGLTRSALHTL